MIDSSRAAQTAQSGDDGHGTNSSVDGAIDNGTQSAMPARPTGARLSKMDAMIDALAPHVEAGDVPGLVAVLATRDEIDVTVIGDQSIGGAPMREDSLFRIASAGKPITAAAVLTLIADGAIAIDDPVDELLPELSSPRVLRTLTGPVTDTVPASRPITVGDLLRSTNGHGFPSDFSAPVVSLLLEQLNQGAPQPSSYPPPDEWMARLGEIPLLHQPGEGFTYNTAFDILGVLVERASGSSFAEFLEHRIFRPLGMSDTGFSFEPAAADRMTTSYRLDADALTVADPVDGQWAGEPAFASGSGGYLSTAADVVTFHRMLLAGGGDILPRDLIAAMTSDQLTPAIRATDSVFLDGQSWGYGCGVDIAVLHPWNVPGRYGWVGGTGTSAYSVPSDGTIAVLLTQVELGGPGGSSVLESFWAAAARHFHHGDAAG